MVQTDTGDQGLDVRKEREKIVAYFEKEPTVDLWVTPDESGKLYVVCEADDDYSKTYSYEEFANFIDENPEKSGSSFRQFDWIDHKSSKFEESKDHNREVEEKSKEIIQLEERNKQLKIIIGQLEEELDGMHSKLLEQEDSSESSRWLLNETNAKIISMIEHVPTADEYSRSYDLLLDYQRQLMNLTDSSNDFNMSKGEVAIIARYGAEISEKFVNNEDALIPMKTNNIEARLHLSENYYEQNDGGTINPYSSYSIAVNVIDKRNDEVKKYNVFDFDEKYKDDIETEEMETTDQLIQKEDEEMIIEERVAINKSKKKRKEKAQGFEMT